MTPHSRSLPLAWSRRAALTWLTAASVSAWAQPTGLLYDPEPPADSAFLRVMLAGNLPKASVQLNSKTRVKLLERHQVSDYLVIPAGKHQIEVTAGGKTVATSTLDAARGSALTVVFTSTEASPHVFVDKTSTNKLKSMLSVYQLARTSEMLDILTSDGATKVFSGLTYGKSAALAVNPISVTLIATRPETKTPLAKAPLNMNQGEAYSVFLLPGKNDQLTALVAENKIERYTGK